MLFRYHEPLWYGFGLALGLKNLARNGTRLGAKKTFGKILQPINSYTRFPEYCFFAESITHFLERNSGRPANILDVGSPKLLGLYLAYNADVTVHLTDVSRLNLDEYVMLWNTIERQAKGRAVFALQDARSIAESDEQFDIVYSMSVIEHIEPEIREPQAISELLRVLKPGGQLLLSVPIGSTYVEQSASHFSYEADSFDDQTPHFFQRIFDHKTVQEYIVDSLTPHVDDLRMQTTFRRRSAQAYHRLRSSVGDTVHGLFGFTNPVWSLLYNRHEPGLEVDFYTSYGAVKSSSDMYGDFLLSCRKR